MARAREVPGLDRETPFALAAARVVEVRTEELIEHSRAVLDLGDIEGVHDMRVATRRLRAALEVFRPCFPKKRFKVALREVKDLADALGGRRDLDVAIEWLESAADDADVGPFIEELQREQEGANDKLRPFVESGRLSGLEERLAALATAARQRA